ncbi:hypothetical protein BGX33_006238 [Mortierella sp. NVP41]|nr:hypothetical protein BGX33_006238 [Mortierella sp. NVP41]
MSPSAPSTIQDHQQTLNRASTHTLDIPEILFIIGESFYPTFSSIFNRKTNRDKLLSLLSFIQVSRLWYKTLHPILWYSYDPTNADLFSQKAVMNNSHLCRIYTALRSLNRPVAFNCLTTLELFKPYRDGMGDMQMERVLVRSNPGLKTLLWEGSHKCLDKNDFDKLGCLQELELRRWDNSGMPFVEVLRAMANTLTTLDLRNIKNFSVGNLKDTDDPLSFQVTLPKLKTLLIHDILINTAFYHDDEHALQPRQLRELVVCSPSLESLEFKLDQAQHRDAARELAGCIRAYCPKFQDLTIHCILGEPIAATAARFIQESSASGLVRLALLRSAWDSGLFSAIETHASTLTDLELTWNYDVNGDVESDAQHMLQIFTHCQHLKRVKVMDVPRMYCQEIFEVWKSEDWACSRLESLCFASADGGLKETLYEDRHNNKDANVISSTNPAMGWYMHEKKGWSLLPAVLRMVFGLVKELSHMRQITFENVLYTRSRIPPVRLPTRPSH